MKITFNAFNKRRAMRGVEAVEFDITDDEGESYCLWMSKQDIKRNIKAFPNCSAELNKGLSNYEV